MLLAVPPKIGFRQKAAKNRMFFERPSNFDLKEERPVQERRIDVAKMQSPCWKIGFRKEAGRNPGFLQ
ncbi:MAG: hypothetical protein BRC23_01810 [Parcubacteria group bacterium SW_4_49_11]|nr:MAG: hypothetical protein BRC23_01810 [Parcubacteria group bacterium SW_4_49_11]